MKASTNIQRRRSAAGRCVLQTVLAAFVLAILLAAGCAQSPGDQQQKEQDLQQRIDELENQKDEDVQKQLDELKARQEEQNQPEEAQQQVEPPPPQQVVIENNESAPEGVVVVSPDVVADTELESSALEAAISYYQAVEVGDFAYTYNALSSADQDNYTYDQWLYANNTLDNATLEFQVFRALVDSPNTEIVSGYPHVADVGLSIYFPDGSVGTRYTFFVYEGGVWKHWLTSEEMDGFDSVL